MTTMKIKNPLRERSVEQGLSLLIEVYKGPNRITLNESQEGVPDGMMRVSGVFAKVNVKNRNGRIYNAENYKKHLEILRAELADGLYGELEHPEGFTIDNNNISHKIEDFWFDEATGEVKGTLLLLDTPKGKIAQSIIRSGGALRVSSRATGTVDQNNNAFIEELTTFDIVGTPGFKETRLLKESLMFKGVKARQLYSDSLCECYAVPLYEAKKMNEASEGRKFKQGQNVIVSQKQAKDRKGIVAADQSPDSKFVFVQIDGNHTPTWIQASEVILNESLGHLSFLDLDISGMSDAEAKKAIKESLKKNKKSKINESAITENGTYFLEDLRDHFAKTKKPFVVNVSFFREVREGTYKVTYEIE